MGAFNSLKGLINNVSLDWLKYAAQSWIIYADETPESLYQKLLRIPELKRGSIFIFYVDISPHNRSGQFPKWIWDWFNKPR